MSGEITGGSAHQPLDTSDEPETFKVKILPAGSAPKDKTFQPNVGGDLAPGQPNNSADDTYDKATEGSKIDVHKGLADDGTSKKEKDENNDVGHVAEIKSASEREPESATSI